MFPVFWLFNQIILKHFFVIPSASKVISFSAKLSKSIFSKVVIEFHVVIRKILDFMDPIYYDKISPFFHGNWNNGRKSFYQFQNTDFRKIFPTNNSDRII
jgi:predicted HD phosphohydrolase